LDGRRGGQHVQSLLAHTDLIPGQRRQVLKESLKAVHGHPVLYWFVEVKGFRKWTFPLVVVGANSIVIYSLEGVLRGWLDKATGVFTFRFAWLGDFAPAAQSCTAAGDVVSVLLALPAEDLLQALSAEPGDRCGT